MHITSINWRKPSDEYWNNYHQKKSPPNYLWSSPRLWWHLRIYWTLFVRLGHPCIRVDIYIHPHERTPCQGSALSPPVVDVVVVAAAASWSISPNAIMWNVLVEGKIHLPWWNWPRRQIPRCGDCLIDASLLRHRHFRDPAKFEVCHRDCRKKFLVISLSSLNVLGI